MITLQLKDLQSRVKKNSAENREAIDQIVSEIRRKNLRKGRVRPKHSTEIKILAGFERK